MSLHLAMVFNQRPKSLPSEIRYTRRKSDEQRRRQNHKVTQSISLYSFSGIVHCSICSRSTCSHWTQGLGMAPDIFKKYFSFCWSMIRRSFHSKFQWRHLPHVIQYWRVQAVAHSKEIFLGSWMQFIDQVIQIQGFHVLTDHAFFSKKKRNPHKIGDVYTSVKTVGGGS